MAHIPRTYLEGLGSRGAFYTYPVPGADMWYRKRAVQKGRQDTPTIYRRARLLPEELEHRAMPATYMWTPNPLTIPTGPDSGDAWLNTGSATQNWSTLIGGAWVPGVNSPGVGDTAIFDGKQSSANCLVDTAVTTERIHVRNGYSGKLLLKENLTLSDPVGAAASSLNAPVTVKGKGGSLILEQKSNLVWWDGTLQDLTVDVKKVGQNSATLTVNDVGNSPRASAY